METVKEESRGNSVQETQLIVVTRTWKMGIFAQIELALYFPNWMNWRVNPYRNFNPNSKSLVNPYRKFNPNSKRLVNPSVPNPPNWRISAFEIARDW